MFPKGVEQSATFSFEAHCSDGTFGDASLPFAAFE